MVEYQQEYERCRALIEGRLEQFFTQVCPQRPLLEAMRYSLLAGGKRIRPVLTIKFCEAAGGTAQSALDFACGVEMLHTYSLIHDDLPCMDDDDLRRGRPSCHKQFGETVATLAGDALQAAAFRTVLSAPGPWAGADAPLLAARFLAEAAGEEGMCGGQYLDTAVHTVPCSAEELTVIHRGKTGALLRAACLMGVCAAGRGTQEDAVAAAGQYADALGMAFQIRDDVLDATATTQVLGKPAGSDAAKEKVTFVTLLGVEECGKLVRTYTEKAKAALAGAFDETGFLCWLADRLAEREG